MRHRSDSRTKKAGGHHIERDPGGRAIKEANVPWIHECTEDEIKAGKHIAPRNRQTTSIRRPLDDYNPWWDDEE